jgi:uncharacterized protein (TIGR03435 family)
MGRRLHRSVPLLTAFVVGTFVVPLPGQAQPDQKPPAFEAATVKKNKSGDLEQHIRRQPGGGLTVTNLPLRQLIVFAYLPLQSFQLVGGPSWIGNDRFDMVAKIEGNPPPTLPGVTPDALMLAMRTLLADRFNLKLHHEQREMDIYALALAKAANGPGAGLKHSTTDCEAYVQAHRGGLPGWPPGTPICGLMDTPGQIRMGGFPLSLLTTALGAITGRMVFDRTGLTGNWDLTLTFQAEQRGQPGNDDVPAPDPTQPSMFTALQEQLGLKLVSTKGSVDVLVIDHVEEPTPD